MSKVNFVSEFNMFMRYARDNGLSLRERMLWIALFYVANDRANYNEQTQEYEWPDDFIQVSNNELNLYCCLDKRAIETLRNTLKQRGLIDFIAGSKNKRNPAYKINYLSINVGYKKVPNPPPNNAPNDVPNNPPNIAPNDAPSLSPLYKYNIDLSSDSGVYPSLDEKDDDDDERLRVREQVQTEYRRSFGRTPTPAELDEITRLVLIFELSEVVPDLMQTTAEANPSNRVAYLRPVCESWYAACIRTHDELEDDRALTHLMKQYPEDAATYGMKKLEAIEKRREKYEKQEASA